MARSSRRNLVMRDTATMLAPVQNVSSIPAQISLSNVERVPQTMSVFGPLAIQIAKNNARHATGTRMPNPTNSSSIFNTRMKFWGQSRHLRHSVLWAK